MFTKCGVLRRTRRNIRSSTLTTRHRGKLLQLNNNITKRTFFRSSLQLRTGKEELDEYLEAERSGGPQFSEEEILASEEEFVDVIYDAPLVVDYRYRYHVRTVAASPKGASFTPSVFYMKQFKNIWVFDFDSNCVRVFNPTEELWDETDKILPKETYGSNKNLDPEKGTTVAIKLGEEHFAVWTRPSIDVPGFCYLTDINLNSVTDIKLTGLTENVLVFGSMFSLGGQLLIRSRYHHERDHPRTLAKLVGHHHVNPLDATLPLISSFMSYLYIYDFETEVWLEIPASRQRFPVCYSHVIDHSKDVAYFFSRCNQGFKVDGKSFRGTNLGVIGRPGNLTHGSALEYCEGSQRIVSFGKIEYPATGESGVSSKKKFDIVLQDTMQFKEYMAKIERARKKHKSSFKLIWNDGVNFIRRKTHSRIPVLGRAWNYIIIGFTPKFDVTVNLPTADDVYDKFLSIGGIPITAANASKEVYVYDIKDNRWRIAMLEGEDLESWDKIAGCGVVSLENRVYVFGGMFAGQIENSKVWIFDERAPLDPPPEGWRDAYHMVTKETLEDTELNLHKEKEEDKQTDAETLRNAQIILKQKKFVQEQSKGKSTVEDDMGKEDHWQELSTFEGRTKSKSTARKQKEAEVAAKDEVAAAMRQREKEAQEQFRRRPRRRGPPGGEEEDGEAEGGDQRQQQ